MTSITVHTDNTLTRANEGKPFGRIDRDSYQMRTGQRGTTTVRIYETGEELRMTAPLYIPRHEGSVSDWAINPAFVEELDARA